MTDLARTLDALAEYLRRYVVMIDVQRDALSLFAAHTHAFDAAESTPYVHVTSAERESGKTRLLEALELVVARPMRAGATTSAALARAVAQDPPPTMLLDETDNMFKRDREYVAALLGILNDGYRRGGQTLLCLPPRWEPKFLPVFAPKVVAGLHDLPDTLRSRSIRLELKRRAAGEQVDRFRRRDAEERAEPLRISIESLASFHADRLAEARPQLPDALGDRAQDCWEPLIAVADLAGGDWPTRARRAAVELSSPAASDEDSNGVRLLADIERSFHVLDADRLATADLLNRLNGDDEAPWGDWYGKPLQARALARLLKPYGVRPSTIRMPDGRTPRGFRREWFEDAFRRYLPSESATLAQQSQEQASSICNTDGPVADSDEGAKPHGYADVADVADPGVENNPDDVDPNEIERLGALSAEIQREHRRGFSAEERRTLQDRIDAARRAQVGRPLQATAEELELFAFEDECEA